MAVTGKEGIDKWEGLEDGIYKVVLCGYAKDCKNGIDLFCRYIKGKSLTWLYTNTYLTVDEEDSICEIIKII